MMEDLPMPKMSSFNVRSPGHEGAGVVVKIGSDVKTWKVGDRGGVKPMWDTCMNCEWCWDGKHETYCAGAIATGLTVAGEFKDIIFIGNRALLISGQGTYQHYIRSPAKYTTRIPDNVDDFTAAPIMCSGSAIYTSVSCLLSIPLYLSNRYGR
jgi:propanol-preferring alcohol dehydrogenase